MAKRFTDTSKWDDQWFSDLPPHLKLLWLYLTDKCDHAGVWRVNKKLAEFQIGMAIDWSEAAKMFDGRVSAKGDYWCITKFLTFQYGVRLNRGDALRGASEILESKGFKENVERVLGLSLDPHGRVKATATAKATAMAMAKKGGVGGNKTTSNEPPQGTTQPKENKPIPDSKPHSPPKPSNPDEVTAYAKSIGYTLDGNHFFNYYAARGWQYKTGQPMKDWRAAVRTWKIKSNEGGASGNGTKPISEFERDRQRFIRDTRGQLLPDQVG